MLASGCVGLSFVVRHARTGTDLYWYTAGNQSSNNQSREERVGASNPSETALEAEPERLEKHCQLGF